MDLVKVLGSFISLIISKKTEWPWYANTKEEMWRNKSIRMLFGGSHRECEWFVRPPLPLLGERCRPSSSVASPKSSANTMTATARMTAHEEAKDNHET